ncbi:MAG: allantoinase AllB [Planctomycetota bacterium]|jgi:allantoinase|nr:allantoinase AllB [Planctomycetota bacterium]
MEKCDLILRCDRVVLEDRVQALAVGVKGGRVLFLADKAVHAEADRDIDLGGMMLFPGMIDPHVHFKEPGPNTHREDWESGSRQAAAGGVTTVMEMPLSIPLTVDKAAFVLKMGIAAKKSHVDFAFWAGMNTYAEGHYREMHDLGAVAFKVFLSTDPDSPRMGDYDFLRALRDVAGFDGLVGVHAENHDIIDNCCEAFTREGRQDGRAHLDSRPDVAEIEAVQRALLFARESGARMHICHLSSAKTAAVMRFYRERGADFTVETCHSYLTLDDSDLDRCGARAKCNPPIRDQANREALWKMIMDGDIQMVASDHSPYLDEDRDLPLWESPPGLSGIDLAFPLMLDAGFNRRGLPAERLARLLATNTARRFELYPRKGVIGVGSDADLVVVDPDAEWTWSWERSLGKSREKATPFEGRRIRGRILGTYVRGVKVYDGVKNVVEVEPGFGKFVRPINNR